MRILGISGSVRRGSHNSELLRAAADILPPGVELDGFDGLKAIPPYDVGDDVEPAPPAVSALREAIASVAVIGASTGMFGGVWAQAELRKVLGAIGARVLDRDLPVAAAQTAFHEDGRLHDDQHHSTLEGIVTELVAEVERDLVAA